MRRLIRDGELGQIVQAFIDISCPVADYSPRQWRNRPEISGGGYFVDLGSHRLDAMTFLLGNTDVVAGVATTFDADCSVEQAVSMSIRFQSGAQCTATGDYYSGKIADRFDIIGTRASIRSDRLDGHAFAKERGGDSTPCVFEPFPAPHLGLIRHIESVLLDGQTNESSGIDALITERMLDVAVRKR